MESGRSYQESAREGGWLGKTLAPLEKKLKNVKWGEYKIENYFDAQTGNVDLQQKDCNGKGEYLINSGLENCGIKGRTDRTAHVFPSNTITIDFWGNAFYRNFPYKMATHNHVFSLSGDIIKNERIGVFLAAQFKYMRQLFSYDNMGTWSKIKELYISLPQTTDGGINFAFIEDFMRELEESRLRELEAYLLATGLDDYQLSNNDHTALGYFKKLRWQEFCIGDLFERAKTEKLPYSAKGLPKQPTGKNTLPCLTSSFMNQGLNYYAPREGATILNHVISIPSNSDVYRAYYQPDDFTVLSDAYAIRWKDKHVKILPEQYLFMVACINKVTNLPIYSYKNKLGGWNVVKDKKIVLPVTDDDQPDLIAMRQLVTAMQKIAIADVALYTSQHLEATRQAITDEQLTKADVVKLNPIGLHYPELEFEPLMAAEPFECYKWGGFDRGICEFFGGNQTILVGCYKDKKYHDWIHAHHIYNIRLGNAKGSMDANQELFGRASLLVLYELGKPNKLSAYKITGHKEMSKDELLQLDYPNRKPRKRYMAFDIEPLGMDLTFLVERHLIERVIEMNVNNAKGTPVFIEP